MSRIGAATGELRRETLNHGLAGRRIALAAAPAGTYDGRYA